MVNFGKILEDRVERVLQSANIIYQREGSKRHYGARGSNKGKFDFLINGRVAIECKSIDRASNLRLPWPRLTNTAIKSHQLRALRKEHEKGNPAGLLIEIRKSGRLYWLTMPQLDAIVQEHGCVAALHLELLERYADRVEDLKGFLEVLI